MDWRIALLPFFLLFGCCGHLEENAPDQLSMCKTECQPVPHSSASIQNGSCSCLCEDGYEKYGGYCIVRNDYEIMAKAGCRENCNGSIPNSVGDFKNGSCTCSCGRGYRMYNRTCITAAEYDAVVPATCPPDHPVLKDYDWAYNGRGYYISLCYANGTAGNATENRTLRKDYWDFVEDPYSDNTVSMVTGMLANISGRENFSRYEQVDFAVAFVQSLPYAFDNVTTPYDDYPRYPSETIYADGGDCEDTAILMAAILEKMGYGVVLLQLPHHMAAGVSCNPSDFDYNVSSYPYDGNDYCYIETTGEDWKMGVKPNEFQGQEVGVVPMRPVQPDVYLGFGRPRYFDYTYAYDAGNILVNVTGIHVDNFGPETATDVRIDVSLDKTADGQVWSRRTLKSGDILPRGHYDGHVTGLSAPSGEPFRISVRVYGDNFQPVNASSDWVTWH